MRTACLKAGRQVPSAQADGCRRLKTPVKFHEEAMPGHGTTGTWCNQLTARFLAVRFRYVPWPARFRGMMVQCDFWQRGFFVQAGQLSDLTFRQPIGRWYRAADRRHGMVARQGGSNPWGRGSIPTGMLQGTPDGVSFQCRLLAVRCFGRAAGDGSRLRSQPAARGTVPGDCPARRVPGDRRARQRGGGGEAPKGASRGRPEGRPSFRPGAVPPIGGTAYGACYGRRGVWTGRAASGRAIARPVWYMAWQA